jgi:REP element-mobilizing transposase RayT
MPDHMHALIEGTHPAADFREFVRIFKQRSSFEWKRRCGAGSRQSREATGGLSVSWVDDHGNEERAVFRTDLGRTYGAPLRPHI